MRILMTTDAVGGVWTYTVTLIRSLGEFGVDVTLAVLGPGPSPAQRDELQTLPNAEWAQWTGPLEWMPGGPEAVPAASEWLLSLSTRTRPDVVHLNGYGHAAWPFGCPVVVVAHSCVCSWWRAVKREPAPASLDVYRRLVTDGLAVADVVVAPTRAMLTALAAEYGFHGRTQVISNGCDLEALTPAVKEPLVFSAARFDDEAKNLAVLERASSAMVWPIVVAGAEPGEGRVHSREPRSNPAPAPAPSVTRLGTIDRVGVAAWLARASIYVAPARYEPFGLSILEAARLRCALVVGDIPSLREVWGAAAVYVDPHDPDALAHRVNVLARHARHRQRMAHAASRRAARYTARACARSYYRMYQALLAAVPQPQHGVAAAGAG
jgi:glycosyltransferase involved in cell wall biosynthesis